MTISDTAKREKDLQQAETYLTAGSQARTDGKPDQAANAFGEAERRFRLAGEMKRAAESCSLLAAAQWQNNRPEQAIRSYQRASQQYKEAGCPGSEAESFLAIGHIERQLGQLDRAQASYHMAQNLSRANKDLQGLGNSTLALGHTALQRGLLEEAVDFYQEAAYFFHEAGDAIHEADAYRSLADVQRMTGHFSEAEAGYKRAQEMYQRVNDVLGGIEAQLGLAHISIDEEQQLDKAAVLLAEALTSLQALEDQPGQADAHLSLARIHLLQGNVDQALVGTEAARQLYSESYHELGLAHANRLLGEIQLRRGHLSYANMLMEHALQTYQTLAFQFGQAEAMVGLGEIQQRRGSLEQALKIFEEARTQARLLDNKRVERRALLGLGDVYYQLGQPGQAFLAYTEAKAPRREEGDEVASARLSSEAEIRLARVALSTGELTDAENHLAAAAEAMTKSPGAAQATAMAAVIRGRWLLTSGEVMQAEVQFRQAYEQAESRQLGQEAAEATLGLAQTHLAREELQAAQKTFAATDRQFQQMESVDGEGFATLGIAQVFLKQQRWDESLKHCKRAILCFNQSHDQPGQADALLLQGLANLGKGEPGQATVSFEQALQRYQQQHRPLGIAQTRSARGHLSRLHGDLERARDEQTQAITQVELVMHSLPTPKQRSVFLCQYAQLYAQTAITDVQRDQDEQGRAVLHHFARLSCGAELVRHLEAYEQPLPITLSENIPREELPSRIHELVRSLEADEHALSAQSEKGPKGALLSRIHELVRLIEAYEDAVFIQSEEEPEEERLSHRKLAERLKQIRRGL